MNPHFLTPAHVDRISAFMNEHWRSQPRNRQDMTGVLTDFLSLIGIEVAEPIKLVLAPSSQKVDSEQPAARMWRFFCPTCAEIEDVLYPANVNGAFKNCRRCTNPSVRGVAGEFAYPYFKPVKEEKVGQDQLIGNSPYINRYICDQCEEEYDVGAEGVMFCMTCPNGCRHLIPISSKLSEHGRDAAQRKAFESDGYICNMVYRCFTDVGCGFEWESVEDGPIDADCPNCKRRCRPLEFTITERVTMKTHRPTISGPVDITTSGACPKCNRMLVWEKGACPHQSCECGNLLYLCGRGKVWSAKP